MRADSTGEHVDLSDEDDLDLLIDLARTHRVHGLVHDTLTRTGRSMPTAARMRLNDLRVSTVEREFMAVEALARTAALLDVPFVAFKGPVLAVDCYDRPGLRSFSDLDVLVRRRDFAAALGSLVDGGLEELASNWDGFLEHGVAEVPLAGDHTVIDLHWHPIALGAHRRDIRLDVQSMIARGRDVAVGTTTVRTFDPEDTLLHLCVNTGLEGANRLLRLVDVDRVTRRHPIDWGVVVDRAHDTGAHPLCGAVLQRARALLGTPVPWEVLERLEPFPGWLGANRLVDRRRDPRRLHRGVASGLIIAAGRETPLRTLAVAVRSAAHDLLVRAGRPRLTDPGGDLHWARSHGAERDADARRRYLAWVGSTLSADA